MRIPRIVTRHSIILALATMLSLPLAKAWSMELIGDYLLTAGTFGNQVSGPLATGDLTVSQSAGSAGFDPDGWSWSGATAPGTGLNLSGLPTTVRSVYSIGMIAKIGETSSYRKLIDYSDLTNDSGLYIDNHQFRFYGITGRAGSVTNSMEFTIVLTRDAARNVRIYLNGNSDPILDFQDPDDFAVASSGMLRFFQDDSVTGSNEFSPFGSVSLIRVWNGALNATDIPLAMIVPEPSAAKLAMAVLSVILTVGLGRVSRPMFNTFRRP